MKLVSKNINEFMETKLSSYKGISQAEIDAVLKATTEEIRAEEFFNIIDSAYREEETKCYDLYIDETGRIFEYAAG